MAWMLDPRKVLHFSRFAASVFERSLICPCEFSAFDALALSAGGLSIINAGPPPRRLWDTFCRNVLLGCYKKITEATYKKIHKENLNVRRWKEHDVAFYRPWKTMKNDRKIKIYPPDQKGICDDGEPFWLYHLTTTDDAISKGVTLKPLPIWSSYLGMMNERKFLLWIAPFRRKIPGSKKRNLAAIGSSLRPTPASSGSSGGQSSTLSGWKWPSLQALDHCPSPIAIGTSQARSWNIAGWWLAQLQFLALLETLLRHQRKCCKKVNTFVAETLPRRNGMDEEDYRTQCHEYYKTI